jgi:hypothetical protein
MKKITLVILFTSVYSLLFSQTKNLSILTPVINNGEGTIYLTDGSELKGIIQFNSVTQLLSYENGNDSKSFTPRSVTGFVFQDGQLNKQRKFISLSYQGLQSNMIRPEFFEALKELKEFAVLSRVDPVQGKIKQRYAGNYNRTNNNSLNKRITFSQKEIIFFMKADGTLHPYLQIVLKDAGLSNEQDRISKRILDKELIRHLTSPKYESIVKYRKEKRLHFDDKIDLLTVMNFYEKLKDGEK